MGQISRVMGPRGTGSASRPTGWNYQIPHDKITRKWRPRTLVLCLLFHLLWPWTGIFSSPHLAGHLGLGQPLSSPATPPQGVLLLPI